MKLSRLPERLWSTSPRDAWRRLTRHERPAPVPPWAQGKHAQWGRLVYYIEAFRRLAARIGHPLDFRGRRVLELGAGPVLGLGPLVLIEGARAFTLVDPGYREVRNRPGFVDDYLYALHAMHSVTHGSEQTTFESFVERVNAIDAVTVPVERMNAQPNSFDIVLSKSCLEHIEDLPRALDVVHAASSGESLHVHYVDFTMHHPVDRIETPFGRTYQQAKRENPEYFGNVRGLLNLLRASEVRALFEERFARTEMFPMLHYRGRLGLNGLHPDWRAYHTDDLAVANAIVVAVK